MTLERIVSIVPAYDMRGENMGIHGCDLRMVLKGPLGAVQFILYTNWLLPHVRSEIDANSKRSKFPHLMCHPLPCDLGYHSPSPKYEGQESRDCDYLDGKPCYYDGSGLNAKSIYRVLLERGSDGVWEELEAYYNHLFNGADWNLPYPDEWKS